VSDELVYACLMVIAIGHGIAGLGFIALCVKDRWW
jgi:hypothetical protein